MIFLLVVNLKSERKKERHGVSIFCLEEIEKKNDKLAVVRRCRKFLATNFIPKCSMKLFIFFVFDFFFPSCNILLVGCILVLVCDSLLCDATVNHEGCNAFPFEITPL